MKALEYCNDTEECNVVIPSTRSVYVRDTVVDVFVCVCVCVCVIT